MGPFIKKVKTGSILKASTGAGPRGHRTAERNSFQVDNHRHFKRLGQEYEREGRKEREREEEIQLNKFEIEEKEH